MRQKNIICLANNDKKVMVGKDEGIAEKNMGHHMEIYEKWLREQYKEETDSDNDKILLILLIIFLQKKDINFN